MMGRSKDLVMVEATVTPEDEAKVAEVDLV